MSFIDITEKQKKEYNLAVTHPLQSFEWGEFRRNTGIKVVRRAQIQDGKIASAYTMTLHPVPILKTTIGYIPKCVLPTRMMIEDIEMIGRENKTTFIQIEPNVLAEQGKAEIEKLILEDHLKLSPSFHPLFTKFSFILDITPSEETLLSNMHSKTRYNIRLAERHKVKVEEDNSLKGFEEFIKLYEETTTRQKFYAHTREYHRKLWESLKDSQDGLEYHLLHARYQDSDSKGGEITLTSWVIFTFNNVIYYPYGASSRMHRDKMANNLIMWEAIRYGKKKKCKEFDMWGALGNNPDTKDPWYGFHRFKEGYGAKLTEFAGSYDLVLNPALYELSKIGDKARWAILNLRKRI